MIWWDWRWGRKLALLAAMTGLSATVTLLIVPPGQPWFDWRAVAGGIAFFTIPQMAAWCLFVGFRTGSIPARGRFSRADQRFDFWFGVAAYCLILAMYVVAPVIVIAMS